MKKYLSLITLALICVLLPTSIYSQAMASESGTETMAPAKEKPKDDGPGFTMAVAAGDLGLGGYGANFEYLLKKYHGVLAEFGYMPGDDASGISAALAYRLHFSGKMNSWYVGAWLKYYSLGGSSTATVNGVPLVKVEYDITALGYGLNVGKRWIFPFGLGLGARLGYGPTSVTADYTGATPDDKKFVEDLLGILLGLDAELTLCWAF